MGKINILDFISLEGKGGSREAENKGMEVIID